MVKLQRQEATAMMSASVKKVLTLLIFKRIGYDMRTATVSLMLINIQFLPNFSLISGMSVNDPK